MKRLTVCAGLAAAAMVVAASITPVSAIKLNVIVGPFADPSVYGPTQHCRWEKRQGPCYTDNVCVWRNKRGRCKRVERRRVCETRDVRVCY